MRLGPHVNRVYEVPKDDASIVSHIKMASESAKESGVAMGAAAIFISDPRELKIIVDKQEIARINKFVEESKLLLIAHASYGSYPWNKNPKAANFIKEELKTCESAGIQGLVIHLPSLPPETVTSVIPKLMSDAKTCIFLETPATSPAKAYYETPKKILTLFAMIEKTGIQMNKIGLCIDTAHLWSCGVDIASYDAAEKWLNQLLKAKTITPDRILIHLNDSLYPCGNGRDAHMALFEGEIWKKYKDNPQQSGVAAVMDCAKKHGIAVILERKPAEKLQNDYAFLFKICPSLRKD